ncbi:MAG TPA: acetate uptake transporter [Acetobacteraceae bacterium]|nr:acetate uptake transporter [Acetobacteraceae bacterium]
MTYANPAPLGLACIALTTWLLNMVNVGWFDASAMPMVLAMAFALGGTTQFCAGLLEFPRGNTFGFVVFCSYGAFWWSLALFVEFFAAKVPAAFVGWYLFIWGAFTFVLWLASAALNRVIQSIFLSGWLGLLALAVSDWTGMPVLHVAGGYLGLLTALLAFYLAAAEVINETRGRAVLPVGAYVPA